MVGLTDDEAGADDQAAHEEAAAVVGLAEDGAEAEDQAAHDDSGLATAVVGLALDQPSHPADVVGAGFLLSLVVHCCHVLDDLAALVDHSFHSEVVLGFGAALVDHSFHSDVVLGLGAVLVDHSFHSEVVLGLALV